MLDSVSPASYRAMINGQSDWGIFPLLLDFSIIQPWVTSSWLAQVSARPTTIEIRAMPTRSESSGSVKSIVRTTVRAGVSPKPYGSVGACPRFLRPENSGRTENSEAFYSFQQRFFQAFCTLNKDPDQIRTILPGFMMSFGSSACLMLRITATASPCSAIRKSILP